MNAFRRLRAWSLSEAFLVAWLAEIHQQAIQRLEKMIKAKDRIVEELELRWGKERADRKRGKL
jgi:hypothetical protein